MCSLEELSNLVSRDRVAVAENVVNEVVKAIASQNETLVGNRLPLVKVLLRNRLILCQAVIELGGDVEGLLSVGVVIETLVLRRITDRIRIVAHDIGDIRLQLSPGVVIDRASNVMVAIVEDLVPEGVKLINLIVVLQREHIGALVTIFSVKLVIESSLAVERLHKIADVVDKQAECVRLAKVLIVAELWHKIVVHVSIFV